MALALTWLARHFAQHKRGRSKSRSQQDPLRETTIPESTGTVWTELLQYGSVMGGPGERAGKGKQVPGYSSTGRRQTQKAIPEITCNTCGTLMPLSHTPKNRHPLFSLMKPSGFLLCKGCCYITGSERASPTPSIILKEELCNNYLGIVRSRVVF